MQTAAIILAAGASTRLGRPKQLATIAGEPLLARAIRTAALAQLSPIIVVLGANAEQVQAALNLESTQVILNDDWQEGMAASVRAGIRALAPATSGVVLLTCDQPAVTARHLQKLVERGSADCTAIASAYAERTGVPAYFPHTRFSELLLLGGDAGARSLLASATSIRLVSGDIDVDTTEALAQARKLFGEGTQA